MGKLGIWNEQQEKVIAQAIDDVYKAKGLLELVDGYLAKVVIALIDDNGLEKLPDDIKPKLSQLTDLAVGGNVEGCNQLGAEILNARIDIPGLDEDSEYIVFEGALTIIVGALIKWVREKVSEK
jgi:hypothetical protein